MAAEERAVAAPAREAIIRGWKPKVKLGKKHTIYIAGFPKKLVFTKLRGRGDAREFYICEAYIRSPVPWDTTVYGPGALENLSDAQVKACEALKQASQRFRGISRLQRKALLSAALRGRSYGGRYKKPKRRRKLGPEAFKRRLEEARAFSPTFAF